MQVVDLQYAPNGIEPVIRVSQFDTGRQFRLRIFDGVTPYVMPSGTTARIDGLKPDKTGFSYIDAVSVENNVVTVTTQDQMTVLSGIVECEIRFIKGSNYIGTLNFKLNVEESPINGDTDMSETDIPAIIELASIQEVNAEAWATGKRNGVDVPSGDETYHNNARYYADEAGTAAGNVHSYAEDSEAWAVGEREGTPVTSEDETYHNNAKYYAGNASDSATSAAASKSAADTSAETSEAYAVGTRNGTAVTSGDVAYHNNSKYYAEEASTSAGNAATSETNAGLSESAAAQSEEDAEAWAVGERNGVAVPSTDPAFQNNAKYYAQQAGGAVNDMTGATASTDGAHGLAPQPLAGDNKKFLRGDGTWSDVPAELSGLEDVVLTNIADGQLLRYNGTAQKWENIGVDSTPAQNSANPIQSGAVYTALTGKQATYAGDATQWDTTPTANSTKPVTSNGILAAITEAVNSIPKSYVGMIIHSTTLDTEAKVKAFYGGTTWAKIEGKFLLGTSSSHAINTTGGAETVTLTVNQIPSHNHGVCGGAGMIAFKNSAGTEDPTIKTTGSRSAINLWSTDNNGGGQAHNNMPPYRSVYIWERTQ